MAAVVTTTGSGPETATTGTSATTGTLGTTGNTGATAGTMGGTGGQTATSGSTGASSTGLVATGFGGTGTTAGSTTASTTGQTEVSCTIQVTSSSVSDVIPTVGIVEWNTDLAGADSAVIEFGLDTAYGQTAPVDLDEPNLRTLLLGMKARHEYHYRVVINAGASSCKSDDFTLQTGDVPSNLASRVTLDVNTPLPDEVSGGYIISSYLINAGGPVFILDEDRDPVWWYSSKGDDVFRARMSFDGKRMWMHNTANEGGSGHVSYVTMDGLEEKIWTDWKDSTHDLAVLPDGKVGLIRRAPNGCDEIFELDPETGETTSIVNLEVPPENTDCHYNALAYYAPDEAYIVSDLRASAYLKISRSGELLWTLNGKQSDFTGTSWVNQHNLHMLAHDRILIYSNGGMGQPTTLFEFQLDEQQMTATELWKYEGGPSNQVGGDVQRLPNGNTLGTYCQPGVIQELNAAAQLVQELSTSAAGSILGHTMFQTSLYGPPPRIYDFEDELEGVLP